MFILSMLHLSAAAENKEGYIAFLHTLQEVYPSATAVLAERASQVARIEGADFSLLRDLVRREVELQNQVSELAEAGIFYDLDDLQIQLSTVREEITEALERMGASGRRSPTPPPSPVRRALSPDFQRARRLAGDDAAAHLEEEGDLPEETDAQSALPSRDRYFTRLEVLRGFFIEKLAENPRLLNILNAKIDELKARFRDDFVPPIGDEFQAVIRTLDHLLLNLARAQALALSMEVRELTPEEEETLGASWRTSESLERQLFLELETGGLFPAEEYQLEREGPVAMHTPPSPAHRSTPPRRGSLEPQEQQRQPSPIRTAAAAMAAPLPPAPMTERERLEAGIQDTEFKLRTAQGPGVFALEAKLRRLREALAKL